MARPLATVAFVPREVFSTTRRSLETLYARTTAPFELVCVDGGSPPDLRDYLEHQSREKQFTLIRTDDYLTPNQARNLALEHVHTPYVVFVDNDVMVSPHWLAPLVRCAEETGAWVVGPLYFEFLPEGRRLHMFGGQCHIAVNNENERVYHEHHRHAHTLRTDVSEPFVRQETELIEFHTVLVNMRAFDELGPLDEGLLCNAEHGDLCMTVRNAGHTVFLEPASEITYVPPPRLEKMDAPFFLLRWSEAWSAANQSYFAKKWDLSPNNTRAKISTQWVSEHRRYRLLWLNQLRKWIGRKWTRSFEKRLIAPIESAMNRHKYHPLEYGCAPKVNVHLVYQPHDVAAAA